VFHSGAEVAMHGGVRFLGRCDTPTLATSTPPCQLNNVVDYTARAESNPLAGCPPILIVNSGTTMVQMYTSVQSSGDRGKRPSRSPSKKALLDGLQAAPEQNSMPVRLRGALPFWFAEAGNSVGFSRFYFQAESDQERDTPAIFADYLVSRSAFAPMPSTSARQNL